MTYITYITLIEQISKLTSLTSVKKLTLVFKTDVSFGYLDCIYRRSSSVEVREHGQCQMSLWHHWHTRDLAPGHHTRPMMTGGARVSRKLKHFKLVPYNIRKLYYREYGTVFGCVMIKHCWHWSHWSHGHSRDLVTTRHLTPEMKSRKYDKELLWINSHELTICSLQLWRPGAWPTVIGN